MIRQFYTFLFFSCVLIGSQVKAQEIIVKKRNVETGKYYSNSNNYTSGKNKSNAKEKYTNCIKYNFLPFFIEIRINPFITLEAGLGVTTNNYMDQLLFSASDFYFNPNGDLRNTISLSQNATIKIFPVGNSYNNGLYIGIDYKNRPYSKILTQNNFSQKATKLFIDIGLIAGYHVRSSERILIDLYAGISQRHITWDEVSLFQTIDPNSGDLITQIQINQLEYPTLGVLLGFKMGYLF
jgi:hypothetical protein